MKKEEQLTNRNSSNFDAQRKKIENLMDEGYSLQLKPPSKFDSKTEGPVYLESLFKVKKRDEDLEQEFKRRAEREAKLN